MDETTPPRAELVDRARLTADLEALSTRLLAHPRMAALESLSRLSIPGLGRLPLPGPGQLLSRLSATLAGSSDAELDALLDAIAQHATLYRRDPDRHYTPSAHAEALRRVRERSGFGE